MTLNARITQNLLLVSLLTLLLSVVAFIAAARSDVKRETDASLRAAIALLTLRGELEAIRSPGDVRAAVQNALALAGPVRHVSVRFEAGAGDTQPVAEPTFAQRWFLSDMAARVSRIPITVAGQSAGDLVLQADPSSEMGDIAQNAWRLLGLVTLQLLALAGALYVAVRRSIAPVRTISEALQHLQSGEEKTRLPTFGLLEFDRISQSFNHLAETMVQAKATRLALTRKLIAAQEDERRRLASELHDEQGQLLTAISVNAASIIRSETPLTPSVQASALSITAITANLMTLLRSMLTRLKPFAVEYMGLEQAVDDSVRSWAERGVPLPAVTLHIDPNVDAVAMDIRLTVYRVIQECMTNTVRHSTAVAITITVGYSESATLQLRYAERLRDQAPAVSIVEGTGIAGMRERVEAHGGHLEIHPGPTAFTITATLPLETMKGAS
jgi:two-component system, NarL family, sensor histidine kinase UhpB